MTTRVWGGSLHQTFRLLPTPSANLGPFLESEGLAEADVLARLPYEAARGTGASPNPKRYRDGRQVYQTIGLLYEDAERKLRITDLGRAVLRWLPILNGRNAVLLGRHAAYALAACQLRNPSGSGSKYDDDVKVFPFTFIWRAMLDLDGQIATDELNRAVFRVTNEDELAPAIEAIRQSRSTGNPAIMGLPTITGTSANDRVISWVAAASFGWTLILDKRATGSGMYEIAPRMKDVVADASRIHHRHGEFPTVEAYVNYIAKCAALPPDLR